MTEIDEITTTDLSKFGRREIELMRDLIDAWMDQGLPDDFDADGVQVMFNTNSGCVFLTNSEYQAAMMNGDKLETFYNCPECGREGFKEEFEKDADCKECRRIAGAEEKDEGGE